jgi:uncharacterized protein
MVINGQWADGSDLLAIPNYARMNRVGPPPAYPGDEEENSGAAAPAGKERRKPTVQSKVWI